MKDKLFNTLGDPNIQLDEIKKTLLEDQHKVFQDQSQNFQVSIRPDFSVSRGKFKVDPLNPGVYFAHPSTIKAMKKDVFVTDPDLKDYSLEVKCHGCRREVDLQFWKFCPHCDKNFSKEDL